MREKEPQGELARYAFGYSDKKPGWTFWVPLIFMTAYVVYNMFTITVSP